MADYYDVNGNKLSSPAAAQPGEIYRDVEGKILPYKDPISASSEKTAPIAGRIGAEALPALGSLAGPGGTLIGTGIMQRLKSLKPEIFGEQPQGADALGNAGKELLLNNVLPAGLSKLGGLLTQVGMQGPAATAALKLSNFPAVREGAVGRMTEQIQGMMGGYKPLGDFQPLKFAEETAPYQPISISPETAISQNIRFNQNTAKAQPIKIIPGEEFQPFTKTKAFNKGSQPTVASTGGAEDIQIPGSFQSQGGAFKENIVPDSFRVGVSGPEQRVPSGVIGRTLGTFKQGEDKLSPLLQGSHIDAGKAFEELTGKDAIRYADAMPPETYGAVKDLLGTMQGMQKKTTLDRIITYRQGRLVWGAGMGALAALGHPGTALLGEGLREGPVVLNGILGKIMENPETAKLVTAALQTPASAPQAGLIQKALQTVLPRLAQGAADIAATPER